MKKILLVLFLTFCGFLNFAKASDIDRYISQGCYSPKKDKIAFMYQQENKDLKLYKLDLATKKLISLTPVNGFSMGTPLMANIDWKDGFIVYSALRFDAKGVWKVLENGTEHKIIDPTGEVSNSRMISREEVIDKLGRDNIVYFEKERISHAAVMEKNKEIQLSRFSGLIVLICLLINLFWDHGMNKTSVISACFIFLAGCMYSDRFIPLFYIFFFIEGLLFLIPKNIVYKGIISFNFIVAVFIGFSLFYLLFISSFQKELVYTLMLVSLVAAIKIVSTLTLIRVLDGKS